MWLFKCFSGHNVLKMSTSRSSRLNVRAGLASKMFAMSEISLLKSDFQWAHRKLYILRCECENKHKRQTRTLTFPTFINFFIRRAKSKTNKIHKPNISDLKHMHNFALHTLRHKQLYFRNWTTNQASNSKCANERVQSRVNSRSTEREQAQHTTQTVVSILFPPLQFFRRHSFMWNQMKVYFWIFYSLNLNTVLRPHRFNTWTTKILKRYLSDWRWSMRGKKWNIRAAGGGNTTPFTLCFSKSLDANEPGEVIVLLKHL